MVLPLERLSHSHLGMNLFGAGIVGWSVQFAWDTLLVVAGYSPLVAVNRLDLPYRCMKLLRLGFLVHVDPFPVQGSLVANISVASGQLSLP